MFRAHFLPQSLHEEISERKPQLERLVAKSASVLQRSADPSMSAILMQLATKYQSLQTTAKVG